VVNEGAYFSARLKQAPRMRWTRFRPFKVTFYLGSPVCLTSPWISFDGLIAHLMLLDGLREDFFITPKKLDLTPYLPRNRRMLPLKRTGEIYHASFSTFIPDVAIRRDTIYKRFEERWTDNLRQRKIRQGQGHYKSYAMTQPYIAAQKAVFYAHGEMNVVQELIERYVYGLGNDFRVGYGAVRDVTFEETPEDWSLVANGVAMRPIPVEMCEEYDDVVKMPCKAPYWNPRNIVDCVPPGARCKLKDGLERGAP